MRALRAPRVPGAPRAPLRFLFQVPEKVLQALFETCEFVLEQDLVFDCELAQSCRCPTVS